MKSIKRLTIFIVFLFFNLTMNAQTVFKVGKKDTIFQESSVQKKYSITLKSAVYPIRLNEIHNWILHIETLDAKIIEDADIRIAGGMPEHGHGFPTTPSVSKHLGHGNYKIEGIKFNMYGVWAMEFSIASSAGFDIVRYLLKIKP
jgi:YtkA-like